MHLIFFMDAIEHCVRIARILRSERGKRSFSWSRGDGKAESDKTVVSSERLQVSILDSIISVCIW
jgi:hypothetical protein